MVDRGRLLLAEIFRQNDFPSKHGDFHAVDIRA